MQLIKPNVNINFIGIRHIAYLVSAAMILVSIGSLVLHGGLNQGIDFAGGTILQVKFASAPSLEAIKSSLSGIGFETSSIQSFGESGSDEYLIRTEKPEMTGHGFSQAVTKALSEGTGIKVDLRRIEMVGPQVGKDLREKALFALFYALLFITIYISGRFELKWLISAVIAAVLFGAVYFLSLFNVSIPILIIAALIVSLILFWVFQLKYAMGAIVALIHDVTITVGLFSLFGKEFTLPIVAALLTIVGYSLNDTIIVFDRIRENLRKYSKDKLNIIINKSINETLSRTILTSSTTLFVILTLLILGGGIIHDLAFALTVGVVVGTYSSIFVASPILLFWRVSPK